MSVPTYAYAANNPLRYSDPTGLWAIQLGFGGTAGLLVGVEGQGGIAFDGEGNFGSFESVGAITGLFGALGTGFTLTWNWDANTIHDLAGDGAEAGLMAGPIAGGWSGSANGAHENACASAPPAPGRALPPACPQCRSPGGDNAYLSGAFISGGGKGLGIGPYIGGTKTWVQQWGTW